MADLPETPTWETGIYQIETTDPVVGGVPNPVTGAGMTNIPHLQIANRLAFLKGESDKAWDTDNCPVLFGANGYQRFGSGLMVQWFSGTISASDAMGSWISFPTPFPNAVWVVIPADLNTSTDPATGRAHCISIMDPTMTLTGFRAQAVSVGSSPAFSTTGAYFVALGR